MISHIWGTIIANDDAHSLWTIRLEGAAFAVDVYRSQDATLKASVGDVIHAHTQMIIREDAWSLYAFLSADEKMVFEKLRSVKGIGPKTAIEILGAGVEAVHRAICDGDVSLLTSIKGLGRKTAERAVLELQEIMQVLPLSSIRTSGKSTDRSVSQEAIDGLIALGFKERDIRVGLQSAPADIQSDTEALIRWYLREAR